MSIPVTERKLFTKLRFAIVFLLLLMSLMLWSALHRYEEYKELLYFDIDTLLYDTAKQGSQLLGADFHNNLTDKNSITPEQDKQNEAKLNILANNSRVLYLYSAIDDHGVIRFTSTSNTAQDYEKNQSAHYFDAYTSASPKLKEVLKTHTITYDEYTDKWGSYRSILLPLQSSNGTWYVMVADVDNDYIVAMKDHAFWEFVTVPIILLFLLSGLGLYYIRSSDKSLYTLSAANTLLNELRQNLESKVNEKTLDLEIKNAQLERFNSSLEERVKEEVDKNRQNEDHMLQQSRLAQLGEMISMIAHQWRQPLAAIASSVLDLKLKLSLQSFDLTSPEGTDACYAYVDTSLKDVENHVLTLTNTIDDFRDFYKADKRSNKLPIQNPIEKAVNIIKSSCAEESITILEEYRATRTITMFNRELIQVFLSILKNAQDNFIQKSISDPIIIITTYHTDKNGVGVTICDNGGGIPESIMPKIFDPYFSTKEDLNGTGLGLYLSKTIVEEHHNGTLLAYNTQNGVCFKLELEGIRV